MEKKIPKGTLIQGAELLSDDCYYNYNDELIVPDGAYLRKIFNQMPFGKINKKVPGIGATTLELESRRNSIIVVPTQYLAHTKVTSKKEFYVGGKIGNKRNRPTDAQLRNYINNKYNNRKKLVVVVDSLPRVMEIIENDLNGWFIMLDEIDSLQEQSNFRTSPEIALDYYFKFDKTQRCVVSATMKEFSHNELNKNDPLVINYSNKQKRKITVINTYDVNLTCKIIIKEKLKILANNEKIVIAYNSINDAVSILDGLNTDGICKSKILCSNFSKDKAKPYFGELEDGKLPTQVNFISSAYFAGIDIHERYHLIYVSSVKKQHTLLSIDKIYQIYGRSRIKKATDIIETSNGVLSENLIHDANNNSISDNTYDTHYLIKKAKAQLEAFMCSAEILKEYPKDIEKMKEFQLQLCEEIGYLKFSLLRLNKNKEFDISYFNIDSMLEFQRTKEHMYKNPDSVSKSLRSEGHHIINKEWIQVESTETENVAKTALIEDYPIAKKISTKRLRKLALDNIISKKDVEELISISKKDEEIKFYNFYNYLCNFIEPELLLQKLQEITKGKIEIDSRILHNLEKSIVYLSIEKDNSIRILFRDAFEIGKEYTNKEIRQKIDFINNLNPTMSIFGNINTDASAIRAIKVFMDIKEIGNRKKGETKKKILNHNPYEIVLSKKFYELRDREGNPALSALSKEIIFNKYY